MFATNFAVIGARLLSFFVLACVREQWDDCSDPLRARDLASMDHNAEFHQGCINVPAPGVDDIYIVLAHRFCDADIGLANATLRHVGARHLYPEPGAPSANRGNGA